MATTPNSPDTSRDPSDTSGSDLPNGRSTRAAQDTAGRQTYGATSMGASPMGSSSMGSSAGRDFYREAMSRSGTGRGATGSSGSSSYGSSDFDRGNFDRGNFGGSSATRFGGSDDADRRFEGRGRTEVAYRGEDWQRGPAVERGGYDRSGYGRGEEGEERSGMSGRTMAMAAAGALGAAGVGLGLARRRRWQREPLTAGEVMSRSPRTVLPEQTLRDVAMLMRDENVGIVPVADAGGRLLGVVTDRDLVVRSMAEDRSPSQVRVSDVMSSDDLEVVTADDPVHSVIELMGRKQVRRIPVVARDNRLLGIIAMADIANRAELDDELQEALERISARRSFWTRLG